MNKELIDLIINNPDLPIFAWVNGEVCEDDCGYWLGKFTRGSIREYAKINFTYGYWDTDWVFKDEPEDLIEYLIESEEYQDLDMDEALDKANKFLDSLEYHKGIFIFVDTL